MLLTSLEQESPHPLIPSSVFLLFRAWGQLVLEGSVKGTLKVTMCRGSEGKGLRFSSSLCMFIFLCVGCFFLILGIIATSSLIH